MTSPPPPASWSNPERLPAGYQLRQGMANRDSSLLFTFLQRTYRELYPAQENFGHLRVTVEQYLSTDTPLWWVELGDGETASALAPVAQSVGFGVMAVSHGVARAAPIVAPVAGLWLGSVVDQGTGDRHAYIFLLYVDPAHRHRGIGSALIRYAERWARERGDRAIGLQVFLSNQPALTLYEKLGYAPQAVWMVKPL